ncbi:MAG TPA: response regulator [Arenimonas sp.]|uniref:response regulator n=1 Tax=Arenimonas sp. TaxID=1872635 RepID=UPI002D80887F|nr:response regulator [Arenimonas sp.]HEU0152419.1 response regulator [Arenimonas sp.]
MNPRLLLVEDDAVTAAFLAQALAPLRLQLVLAGDLAQARARVDGREALWLFDARLPDGRGDGLLAELRARGYTVPALALTAEDDPAALAGLRAAGFAAVLAKPITAAALRRALEAAMSAPARPHGATSATTAPIPRDDEDDDDAAARAVPPPWDDAAALSALGGDPAAVQALRGLFLKELPAQSAAVEVAWSGRDDARLREQLHRLKASCAFVGAGALLGAVRALHARPDDAGAHARFQAEARALADAAAA